MPVRLQRKVRKNKARAAKRKADVKRLMFVPVIKRVDVESMRQSFEKLKAD